VIEGQPFDIFGDGKQLRDFNHVDDVVDAFLATASDERSNGEIYNLGSQERVNLLELAELLVAAAGKGKYRVIPFPPERKAIDIGDYYSDFEKIRHSTGWSPKVPLKTGLRDTVAFFEKYRDHYMD
jgi:nucleoside-diphosphate-sugar epimerase